jgi:alkylation response protein AidB-like acyl-CoA dehydrogenase
MADFGGENPEAFRSDVRGWLEANYPAELRSADVRTDPEAIWGGRAFLGSEDPQIVWMRRVAEKGWTAPTWPAAYGGGGLSPDQGRILEQELARGRYRTPLS